MLHESTFQILANIKCGFAGLRENMTSRRRPPGHRGQLLRSPDTYQGNHRPGMVAPLLDISDDEGVDRVSGQRRASARLREIAGTSLNDPAISGAGTERKKRRRGKGVSGSESGEALYARMISAPQAPRNHFWWGRGAPPHASGITEAGGMGRGATGASTRIPGTPTT